MRREEYLYTLTAQIRCKMARGTIEQEINDHIEDEKAEFLSEGMRQPGAGEAAVSPQGILQPAYNRAVLHCTGL